MTGVHLDLTYSAAQNAAFFDHPPGKYFIYPKGRRVGFTRGGMQAACEWALEGLAVLWGDTISVNIRKYVERYALPFLQKQRIPHTWNVVEKTLRFETGGFIDFRSADNPENWEGFGYHKVLLNEAGIILEGENGRYLYQNSVLPMLLDFPESELYAFGVPKGTTNLFYDLHQRAVSDQTGYHTRTFTSHDSPWLRPEALTGLIEEMRTLGGQTLVDQEIFGRFVNIQGGGLRIIPEAWVRLAFQRWKDQQQPEGKPSAIGVDVARGGADKTVFAPRWGTYLGRIVTYPGTATPDGPTLRDLLLPELGQGTRANIDIVGVGSSPYDFTKQAHAETYPVNGGLQGIDGTDRTGNYRFANLRAKLYWQLREALDPEQGLGLALPPDEELLVDLTSAGWEPRGDKILVEKKDDIKKRIGRSPDKGDAVTYAFYEPPVEEALPPSGIAGYEQDDTYQGGDDW
ncbi:hypothetical protein GCM10017784_11290 [Deinococcus indicus]|uniref:hypothetical protein n=1 Tax=Deinococcus indicus TaxID=223556 RepID=UPI00174A6C4F|nr:hypothetical protein [Deinococcus indicus]GHG21521.1 hypothetical protein GCM10017784_11290 [Deinococcus indicus]